jgi:hypothetical protein
MEHTYENDFIVSKKIKRTNFVRKRKGFIQSFWSIFDDFEKKDKSC